MPTLLEARFIRACASLERPLAVVTLAPLAAQLIDYEYARLVCLAKGSILAVHDRAYDVEVVYRISPRGLDLLATADAIGFDPATLLEPVPEPIPCDACENGRVVIAWNARAADPEDEVEITAGCEKCGGSGEQPPLSPRSSVGDFVNALNSIAQDNKAAALLSTQRLSWDSAPRASKEVYQPAYSSIADCVKAVNAIEDTRAAWQKAADTSDPWRTAHLVYYRSVSGLYADAPPIEPAPDPWTRDHDGMLSLLTRAEAEGLEVETQLALDYTHRKMRALGGVPQVKGSRIKGGKLVVLQGGSDFRIVVPLIEAGAPQGIAITAVRLKDQP